MEGLRLEEGFDLLNDLLGCLTESETWGAIHSQNAVIKNAADELYQQLEEIKEIAGSKCVFKLEDSINFYTGALNDAAILYGFRVALKLFHAISRPMEMSQYIAKRSR